MEGRTLAVGLPCEVGNLGGPKGWGADAFGGGYVCFERGYLKHIISLIFETGFRTYPVAET